MNMSLGDIAPELALLGGSVLTLIYALVAPRRLQRVASVLCVVVIALAALLTVTLLVGGGHLTFSDTYAVDGAALWGKLIILAATAAVAMLSAEWFNDDPRHGEYYVLLLLSALGAVALAGAADLMGLLLGVLLSSSTSAVLIGFHRRSKRSGEAALKFYLLGALTNGVMTFGIVLLFGLAGTTVYAGLPARLAAADPMVLTVGTVLCILGLLFKLGAAPVHQWLPDAADGAPAPVAAFVSVVPKIGALIAAARLLAIMSDTHGTWRPLVAIVAAVTMTLGNVAALWQDDVRRLLGWSAVSQSGYGLMALVALRRSELALPALLFFLLAYALATLAAFGVVIVLRGLAGRQEYAGLGTTRPWAAGAMLVALLSYIGVPPLAGFSAKLALFGAAIDAGYGWLAVVAIVNTAISIAYYARVLAPMYFDAPVAVDTVVMERPSVVPIAVTLAAAGLLVGMGIYASPPFAAFRAARLLPGQ